MSEQKRVIYTKEELAAKVKVPAIVEQDLKRIISDRLEQCGLYYRCFSRIKTASSMAHKFALKDYGAENKKLQDLVGVRINLYFDDDVEICQNIVENTFDVIGWSTSERSEEEFKPTKLNGVCVFRNICDQKFQQRPGICILMIPSRFRLRPCFSRAGMRSSTICAIKERNCGRITRAFPDT